MRGAASSAPDMRFGSFEAHLNSGELRKRGLKIKLQNQPFQVLVILLKHAGEVVTREELRQKLWPTDTFVDFDHGLNNAINRLREAICDSAEHPKFIETLPRHGYLFIAQVVTGGAVTQPSGSIAQQDCPQAVTPEASARANTTGACADQGPRAVEESAVVAPCERQPGRGPPSADKFPPPLLRVTLIVMLLVTTGVGWFTWQRLRVYSGSAARERIHALAVLPLENLSADKEQEYFVDGMTDALITELAKIGSLRVISRTSSMRYKRTGKPLSQIARELNVDAVLEGSVVRSQNRVRVSARLIKTAGDRHIWAEIYERDLRDVLELQGEIARSVASLIKNKVTPEERARLGGNQPVNPEAYEAFLKGRYFWNRRTELGLTKSLEYFRQAIDKDAGYALAHAGLADSYGLLGGLEFLPPRDAYSKAKAAARRALALDDRIGEAHTVLADAMYMMDWDWRGAEREFKRAIALSPGYATAHQRYSLLLLKIGRTEESLFEIHRAQTLDPLSLSINASVGWRLLWARQYNQAIDVLQKTLEMDPNFCVTHLYLGWAYEAKGNPEKAILELQKAVLLSAGPREKASLGHAYALGRHTRQAQNILRELEERSRGAYVPAYDIAIIYAGLGEKDRAFEYLAKAYQDRSVELTSLKADLELDNLRSDPRFNDLLHRVGLPP